MTLTLEEFIKKWTGQLIDFDGYFPNQCFDLAHEYIYEVLGITDKTIITHPCAYEIFTLFNQNKIDATYFNKIENNPDNVPAKGDIVVFGQEIGECGHVCVFVDGDAKQFNSFDANWPLRSLPHIQSHNYKGVVGWLTPKGIEDQTLQQKFDQCRKDRDDHWNELVALKQSYGDLNTKFILLLGDKEKIDNQLTESLNQLAELHNTTDKQNQANILALKNSTAKIEGLESQVLGLTTQLASSADDKQKQINTLTTENGGLKKRIDDLPKECTKQLVDNTIFEIKPLKWLVVKKY